MRSREEGKNLLPACFTGPSDSSVNPHDVLRAGSGRCLLQFQAASLTTHRPSNKRLP